jgi:putative membrane protein
MEEIEPVVREAGFHLPDEATEWHRPSSAYAVDRAVLAGFILGLAGAGHVLAGMPIVAVGLGLLGVVLVLRAHFLWRHDRHALDETQVFVRRGWLSPRLDLAGRVKVQSVELSQGPLARRRGYATLHFGIAGGSLAMAGLPLERAWRLARAVLDSAAAVDFSELPR